VANPNSDLVLPVDLLETVHQAAVAIAQEAGDELSSYFAGRFDVRFKTGTDKDPVTAADEALETLVRSRVAARFSDHGVLGEEGVDTAASAAFVWVVDPLDGTANFANGLQLFSVSIGVLYRGSPVVAALFTTFGPGGQRCVIHARRGGGLLIDGRPYLPSPRPLGRRARLAGVPAGFHGTFWYRFFGVVPPGETRSLGSTAVELGLVATGILQYAMFSSPRIWDVAAGVLLITEGGGTVFTDQRHRWRRLERFSVPARTPLRGWKQAVLAGDTALVSDLVRRTRVRRSPPGWPARLIGKRQLGRLASVARRFGGLSRLVARRGSGGQAS